MRVPQMNERVKEVPAHALRAMFAGIGQLLSVTDKLRSKSAQAPATAESAAKVPKTTAANGAATAPEAVVTTETVTVETPTPETTAPETTAAADAVAVEPKIPTPDVTPAGGHVKLIPPEKTAPQAAETASASAPVPMSAPAPAEADEPAVTEPAVAEPAVAEPAVAEPAVAEVTPAAELPLANYDSLTIASLRARLRNLSVAQLGQLIAYEKAHAARADVIAMFERRVAKLESES
jgi:hypothetical protein